MSEEPHGIEVRLDRVLLERGMTLAELAERVGLTYANLSILKNNRARAIRFSTLTRLCEVLECEPGDLLVLTDPRRPAGPRRAPPAPRARRRRRRGSAP
jgi:putative transcriptional regulator